MSRHYTAEQVIERLKTEIAVLHCWLIDSGQDGTSQIFKEKAALMADKIKELESFNLISIQQ